MILLTYEINIAIAFMIKFCVTVIIKLYEYILVSQELLTK